MAKQREQTLGAMRERLGELSELLSELAPLAKTEPEKVQVAVFGAVLDLMQKRYMVMRAHLEPPKAVRIGGNKAT